MDKIFTEDVLDLIGAAAIRDKLGVKSAGGAGRLVIRSTELDSTRGTGHRFVAAFVIDLLSSPRESGKWVTLQQNHEYAQNPINDEESREAKINTTLMAFTIIELNKNPAASIEHIVGRDSGLPTGYTIRWLADYLPAATKAAPEVLAAIKKPNADDWTVEAALVFLRRAYPEIAATGPPEQDEQQARPWWIARLSKPKQG